MNYLKCSVVTGALIACDDGHVGCGYGWLR